MVLYTGSKIFIQALVITYNNNQCVTEKGILAGM